MRIKLDRLIVRRPSGKALVFGLGWRGGEEEPEDGLEGLHLAEWRLKSLVS